jgi:hypothetical protein
MKKFIIVAFLILFLCGTASAQFETPDLRAGKVRVNRVVLLPVEAIIYKSDWKFTPADPLKPGDILEPESRQVEKDLVPVLAGVFRDLGCTVDDGTFSADALSANEQLHRKAQLYQAIFEELVLQITQKPKEAAKNHVGFGERIMELPGASDADAFVFVLAYGSVQTKGHKVNNFFSGVVYEAGWYMSIGVVDAKTGTILYLAPPSGEEELVKQTAKVGPQIEKFFTNFAKENVHAVSPQ